eukprot:1319565-Lingulodinium_polyedra.AAC.1
MVSLAFALPDLCLVWLCVVLVATRLRPVTWSLALPRSYALPDSFWSCRARPGWPDLPAPGPVGRVAP